MNKDLETMVQLQKYWDKVLKNEAETSKCEKTIININHKNEEYNKNYLKLQDEIKNTKALIKQKEIDLAEKDNHIVKLNKRKDMLKTEREVEALDHELIKVTSEKDALEENLIAMFDKSGEISKQSENLKKEIDEYKAASEKEIVDFNNRIMHYKTIIDDNKKKFDSLAEQLSPPVKSRFQKLIKSSNGKGIVAIERENCSGCNFSIPLHLINDAASGDKLAVCTNCGRYIYVL